VLTEIANGARFWIWSCPMSGRSFSGIPSCFAVPISMARSREEGRMSIATSTLSSSGKRNSPSSTGYAKFSTLFYLFRQLTFSFIQSKNFNGFSWNLVGIS
jgi:hypothetical protein